MLNRNPLSEIRRRQEGNDRIRYLSLDEENLLVAAIESKFPLYAPIFRLSVASGMRMSEQFRAVEGDFDPHTGMLAVHRKRTATGL